LYESWMSCFPPQAVVDRWTETLSFAAIETEVGLTDILKSGCGTSMKRTRTGFGSVPTAPRNCSVGPLNIATELAPASAT